MKTNKIIVIVVLVLVVAIIGYRFLSAKTESSESIDDIQKRDGIPVNVQVVNPAPFERWRVFSGTVEGKKQATLYSNIPARVRKVHAKQGDKVSRGKTIISLDPLSATLSYSALRSSKIQYEDAKRLYERMKPLYEAGAVSKEDFDRVESGVKMARAGYTDISSTISLKSPISAILTDLRVNPGDKVDPGQTLAVVADLSGAKMIMNVSQSDVEEIRKSQKVVLGNTASERNTSSLGGTISKISLSADMKSRLFRVEADLDYDENLRPGTLRYVQVRTFKADNAISIPLGSVIQKNEQFFVYIVNAEGKSELRQIQVGHSNETDYEVLSGLTQGETLVIWGQNRLTAGDMVKIIDSGSKETSSDETNS